MSSIPHTPLPWRIEPYTSHEVMIVATTEKQQKALVASAVLRADAELIMAAVHRQATPLQDAAPDLLAALKALFAAYKQLADSGDAGFWSLEETDVGRQAMAAIAKATGDR